MWAMNAQNQSFARLRSQVATSTYRGHPSMRRRPEDDETDDEKPRRKMEIESLESLSSEEEKPKKID